MAKKNSTKTATKEAIQDAIPRTITFTRWTGIDLQNIPMDAENFNPDASRNSWEEKAQSDAQPTFLAIQNNINTTSNGTLATRYETQHLKDAPTGYRFSGISLNFLEYVYCVLINNKNEHELYRFKLPSGEFEKIEMKDNNVTENKKMEITDLTVFQSQLICMTHIKDINGEHGEMFTGSMDTLVIPEDPDPKIEYGISNAKHVNEPLQQLKINPVGITEGTVARLRFTYVYCNKYGSTAQGPTVSYNTNISPVEFQSSNYLELQGEIPEEQGITGVDLYCTMDESQDYIFIGHVGINKDDKEFSFSWLGAMMDTSQWTTSSLTLPNMNTTDGVDATYIDQYDGRLYFYGGSTPYRLYIGGNIGNELTVATGLGGAFIDIEPGSGQEIRKVLKFKTYNGATVVTLLTYHPNTNKSSRYNLLETEITVTNEYAAKGYTYERVDNVLGVSSYYGADTFLDGLYAVNRYGLGFTTHVQENQNNLRMMYCSDAISPIFETLTGYEVNESRLLCINDKVYLILAKPPIGENAQTLLDDIIFVYSPTAKAWYTHKLFDDDNHHIRHAIHIDSSKHIEGMGIISDHSIDLLPTTGDDYAQHYSGDEPHDGHPQHTVFLATHELAMRMPVTNLFYCNQLEINFDCICAPYIEEDNDKGLEIWVEGYDIYGRHFKVAKNIIEPKLLRQTSYYMRIDRYVKSFRLFIKGKAHFRLTHINMKCFQQSTSINNAYGFDTWHVQRKQHNKENLYHHELKNYNNLKEIIMT